MRRHDSENPTLTCQHMPVQEITGADQHLISLIPAPGFTPAPGQRSVLQQRSVTGGFLFRTGQRVASCRKTRRKAPSSSIYFQSHCWVFPPSAHPCNLIWGCSIQGLLQEKNRRHGAPSGCVGWQPWLWKSELVNSPCSPPLDPCPTHPSISTIQIVLSW